MKFDQFYSARRLITNILADDLHGPVDELEILCDERPLDYYILGKLYPQKSGVEKLEAKAKSDDAGGVESESFEAISLSNSNYPSSLGISFCLGRDTQSFDISLCFAVYNQVAHEYADGKLGFQSEGIRYSDRALFWERKPLNVVHTINLDELLGSRKLIRELDGGLTLFVHLHREYPDGDRTITVSLVNTNEASEDIVEQNKKSFFQVNIEVNVLKTEGTFLDVRRNIALNKDDETLEMEMLYLENGSYASGHGCAVRWDTADGRVQKIWTDAFPEVTVNQMRPSDKFSGIALSMKYLSEGNINEVLNELKCQIKAYALWIDELEIKSKAIDVQFEKIAMGNIEKCRKAHSRINNALFLLSSDSISFKAFQLANKAMFLQSKKTRPSADEGDIRWRPFQLAFILQELGSFINPKSDERDLADLLWFPTGGGKTEAYFGIAAFAIFLRRLRNGDSGNGVAVLMRYTMRLLSFQQFERAAALICAAEIIRKEEGLSGGQISLGLWVGRGITPNSIKIAEKILNGDKDTDSPSSNPVQIKRCPWCGHKISAEDYSCDSSAVRMTIKCPNRLCEYHAGLPLMLIDEEIYQHMPTFLVATIDKFAQLALSDKPGRLLGGAGLCLPPDLIIQDELHLISGPLGTITGIYEAAIRKLCEKDGINTKVIASTATIRNAASQIRSLFGCEHTQFPPQGIDIRDSFFAELADEHQSPSRLYLGCMGIGTSATTMFIRVMASLQFATRFLEEQGYSDDVIDSFWTLTGYFNSLRELGGALVRVVDDTQDRYTYLRKGKFRKKYPLLKGSDRYARIKELTSRESGENIGTVLQEELQVKYPSEDAYDYLLASNMISVGLDVQRLGTMVVVGQPKTTAEYIQATSRVGRGTPGLVITTLNQSKSRDRSHYEQFRQYHSSYYKFVEPTSVTPFSDRARDRALHALYIILCRNMVPVLMGKDGASRFSPAIRELRAIENYIYEYVKTVDPDEVNNVRDQISDIKDEWIEVATRSENASTDLEYHEYFRHGENYLLKPDSEEKSRFRIMNSMRSVELMVDVYSEE